MTVFGVLHTRVSLEILDGVKCALRILGRSESASVDGVPLAGGAADLLYLDWYLKADGEPTPVDGPPAPWQIEPVGVLRAAHSADGEYEAGWQVARVSNLGRLHVRRPGRPDRVVPRADVLRHDRPFLPARPGDVVEVSRRHDLEDPSGFWYTFLGGWDPESPPGDVVRIYFAVSRSAAADLVHRLTEQLPRELACSLKVAVGDDMLGRPDAAVLYASAEDLPAVLRVARDVRRALGSGVRSRTPPLTLPLGDGLALAEEPPGGKQSFGQHRCDALLAAAAEGPADDGRLLRRAREQLVEAGIDHRHPYRNLGSTLSIDADGRS
ncbi:T3SS effector HopA1 family protein [Nocardioides sediminis]|uniref:T3SS effector HopA1 family protein n=1 Tax=Nocardioides sediminis TaxID=433648 RepID=UPI000D313D5B|nr:T3SS effector HopA1 family protein [Nocardioides sediminis]